MPQKKLEFEIDKPKFKWGQRVNEALLEFLVGHYTAAELSSNQRRWLDKLISPLVDRYKSGDIAEANKQIMYAWARFRREMHQHFSLENLEADAVYISHFARRSLTGEIDPKIIHDARILVLHPYGYFVRCATYLLLTDDESFANSLPKPVLEVVLDYTDMHKADFSKTLRRGLDSCI